MQQKLLFSYSDADCYEQEREYLKYNWQDHFDEEPNEEQVNEWLYNADFDYYWQDFKELLTDLMTEINKLGYWLDEARGLTWRNLNGSKVFEADTAEKLLEAITPNTSDYSISIYKGGKTFFYARISHHDCPMGEWHRIKRLGETVYNQITNN